MKITSSEFAEFLAEYFKEKENPLRLGQHFLNKFFPTMVDPGLFYQEDNKEAIKIITREYLE